MKTLVTGGAGYIGTHVLCAMDSRPYASIDNYVNSSPRSLDRVARITGREVEGHELDIRDAAGLQRLLASGEFDSVIHLAGLKAVGESVAEPDRYHENNVDGTRILIEALAASSIRKFVFSSSATVYGAARQMPIVETTPVAPQSPYGQNKVDIENMLQELASADPSWRVMILRYFNPVGAHSSGLIGEHPDGVPNNLMPFICQTAVGLRKELQIFGNDYPTPDGTGIRDYVHVMDLAEGHVVALNALDRAQPGAVLTLNLGTGIGYSVLQLVEAFERINQVTVPSRIVARRPGDTAVCYADARLAERLLHWVAKRGLDDMVRDAWRWQQMNPNGYD